MVGRYIVMGSVNGECNSFDSRNTQDIDLGKYIEVHTLKEQGFELHVFPLEAYNAHVSPVFALNHPPGSTCVLVLSLPCMFERTFLPWLTENGPRLLKNCSSSDRKVYQDPLDSCLKESLRRSCLQEPSDIYHDFDLAPGSRRPLVCMQVAAHVAGAAYYYRPEELIDQSILSDAKKTFGVCLHPQYGGWFAIRALIVLPPFTPPVSNPPPPVKLLETDEQISDLLYRYNQHWRDWTFRDVIPALEKYSPRQKQYFDTPPRERWTLVEKWLNEDTSSQTVDHS